MDTQFTVNIVPPKVRINITEEDRSDVDDKMLANAGFLVATTRREEKDCLASVKISIRDNDWASAHDWLEAAHLARLIKQGKASVELVHEKE